MISMKSQFQAHSFWNYQFAINKFILLYGINGYLTPVFFFELNPFFQEASNHFELNAFRVF